MSAVQRIRSVNAVPRAPGDGLIPLIGARVAARLERPVLGMKRLSPDMFSPIQQQVGGGFVNLLRMPLQHIAQINEGVKSIEPSRVDQSHHGNSPLAAFRLPTKRQLKPSDEGAPIQVDRHGIPATPAVDRRCVLAAHRYILRISKTMKERKWRASTLTKPFDFFI